MKKILAIAMVSLMICASGCSSNSEKTEPTKAPTVPEATAAKAGGELPQSIKETIELYGLEGVVYAVENGKPIASYAKGKLENGDKLTLESPLPVGSVSKQFCAAAIMLLQEQGKLSVDDTLDKYYPEYKAGKKAALHDLLSMTSGLPELTAESAPSITLENTEEENIAEAKKWLFSRPLSFEPGEKFSYANINFLILSDIVSQVSGQKYIDFLRESFFEPLGMKHTGSIGELSDSPDWAQGNTYEKVDLYPGITNGCGDLISNAADLTAWINALSVGKAVSAESYKAMTTNHSPDTPYGYGLFLELNGGVGHYGGIGIYSAFDYINADRDFTLVLLSNNYDPTAISSLSGDFLTDLLS